MSSVTSLAACAVLAVATLASTGAAQAQNVTGLTGTWASGSGKVLTGLDFFNPIEKNFTIPTSGGISYSFIEDLPTGGHFETSQFRFTSNPSSNRCFTAALTWQHGTFTNNANGSLSLTPYAPDGYVQVMDPCAAQSTQIYSYNQFELIPQWFNYLESSTGYANIAGSAYAMKMFEDDGTGTAGTPKAIMYLINRPPTMLPTVQLHEEVLNSVGAYD
ncbi:hypothetical protein BDZ90DRAFT_224687 [Jaminaea rosea]|uniref:Uncharacterized protein n=1 Tax=Jaminaea rosea TaxID=1569628 RepID=A0A316UH62_9BASI|nr:hypothetical protein BDZ90DRAFT_224687 [Jaminaea rosea]PWN24589.1 hypothetical protein BDZ90DRAFT_224687 [Jaminaea rosea]